MNPYPIIIHVSAVALWVTGGARGGGPATHPPATSAPSGGTPPTADASPTLPGRHRFIHHPMSSAMGIVHAMVNRPQGDALRAFTTINASTASRMIMMNSTASIAVAPAAGFTSSFAICPSDLPSRRNERSEEHTSELQSRLHLVCR